MDIINAEVSPVGRERTENASRTWRKWGRDVFMGTVEVAAFMLPVAGMLGAVIFFAPPQTIVVEGLQAPTPTPAPIGAPGVATAGGLPPGVSSPAEAIRAIFGG
jgi:hypothetical protein